MYHPKAVAVQLEECVQVLERLRWEAQDVSAEDKSEGQGCRGEAQHTRGGSGRGLWHVRAPRFLLPHPPELRHVLLWPLFFFSRQMITAR